MVVVFILITPRVAIHLHHQTLLPIQPAQPAQPAQQILPILPIPIPVIHIME